MALEDDQISLRPLSLRPGGAAPANSLGFAAFSKGAGRGLRTAPVLAAAIIQPPEPEAPRKPRSQIVRYERDFLLQFMDRHIKCPTELQQLQLEILISEDNDRETQRQSLKQVADDAKDERDWRARAPAPMPLSPEQHEQQQQQRQQQQLAPAATPAKQPQQPKPRDAPQAAGDVLGPLQRAEDVGRTAYRVGGTLGHEERALRAIRGILNKLTPEKFERLLAQLLEVVTTADLLRETISLVFDRAVAQPTFTAMYAELCVRLSRELPSFPPPPGDDRPVTFRRVLLNTCQDEFEDALLGGSEAAGGGAGGDEAAAAMRRARNRVLGTVRLIAHLYTKDVLREGIVVVVLRELLEAPGRAAAPPDDNVEAAAEVLMLTGRQLSASDDRRSRDALDGFMAKLAALADSSALQSRLRFLLRDVADARRAGWVPRREAFTAKTLDEVHAEAEAELGLVSSSRITADLPALPALPAQRRDAAADEFALLPPLRSGGDAGWDFFARGAGGGSGGDAIGASGFGAGGSALLGEYVPPTPPAASMAAPAAAVALPAAVKAAVPVPVTSSSTAKQQPLTAEDVALKAASLLREFVSVGDRREAATCLAELRSAPKATDVADLSGVVAAAAQELFDAPDARAAAALTDLLVSFFADGLLTADEACGGLAPLTSAIGDVALDVPKAPRLLGEVVGRTASAGVLPLAGMLARLLDGAEGAEAKRAFGAAVFDAFAESAAGGQAALAEAAKGLSAETLFGADEFDGDLPSVGEWLSSEGLGGVVLL